MKVAGDSLTIAMELSAWTVTRWVVAFALLVLTIFWSSRISAPVPTPTSRSAA